MGWSGQGCVRNGSLGTESGNETDLCFNIAEVVDLLQILISRAIRRIT